MKQIHPDLVDRITIGTSRAINELFPLPLQRNFNTPDVLLTNGTGWACLYPESNSGLQAPMFKLAKPDFIKVDEKP